MSKSENTISRIPFDLPADQKAELTRLAKVRHDRQVNPMLRQIVREWIASEQAAEVAEHSEAA